MELPSSLAGAWRRLAELPLTVESFDLAFLSIPVADWERVTTVVALHGAGETGKGEDVTYEADEHARVRESGTGFDPAGETTLGAFCARVAATDLFPHGAPGHDVSRRYRRWAWESAALDLALRQSGTDLATALGREPKPVTFVSSARVGEPPTTANLQALLEAVPGLRFKLDAGPGWDPVFVAALAGLGRVDCVDFKAFYENTPVDVDLSPEQVLAIAEGLPGVTLEDVAPGETTALVATANAARMSWDAPIHSVADIDALPVVPQRMNVKPSRIGSIEELLAVYERLTAGRVAMYGGGQFELSVGRGQIILLASLMHPGGANDTAPAVFHRFEPGTELPGSPLPAPEGLRGFRWPGDE